jgi:mannose-1-phosphate guanylyltransferase
MDTTNYVVIMAGGAGTRLWPYSRTHKPKQFQDIMGTGRTLIQMTADRFKNICPPENIYVVTHKFYHQLVKTQLPQLSDDQILLEPFMRNTAPCIAYACFKIAAKNPNANIIVAPADHLIKEQEEFEQTIETALQAAFKRKILITLGII